MNPRLKSALRHIQEAPGVLWIMLGFFLSYLPFFVWPVFLGGSNMQVLPAVPAMTPIGHDLTLTMSAAQTLMSGRSPYSPTMLFPPAGIALLSPLLVVDPSRRYLILSLITLTAYVVATLLLPLKAGGEKRFSPELTLVFTTGLLSYGLQFELERGQFNVIAAALTYLAIWIYHSGKRHEVWAYLLFTIAVQLKLYPLIFIVMLVRDWRDWKGNLQRLGLLGLANAALLFVVGPGMFVDFMNAVRSVGTNITVPRPRNHSIHSFVTVWAAAARRSGYTPATQLAGILEYALLAVVGACLLLIILKAYRERSTGLNSYLLLACTLGAVLIPAASNDYTLSILAGPVAIFLSILSPGANQQRRTVPLITAIVLFSFAYSSTLLPYTYKPDVLALQDLMPALLVMLILTTCIAVWWRPASQNHV